MSLRWHLLGLLLAALVPVVLFSGLMIYHVADQQRSALKVEIDGLTDALARDVDAQLAQTIAALEVLALTDSLVSDDLARFYPLAQRVLKSHPAWANIVLAGPGGEHLLNLSVPYGSVLPPLNRPDLFIETARARRPNISNTISGSVTKLPLVVVTVPIFRGDEVKYVLAGAFDARTWASFLRTRLLPGMEATLVDREYTIVARTLDNERFAGKKPADTFLDAVARNPEGGVVRGATLEGFEGYGAYQRSKFSGWTVAAFMPADQVDAPVATLLAQLAIGFLLLVSLGVVLAWLVGRRISTSIAQLTASVRSVGSGAYPVAVSGHIAEVREASEALDAASALLAERLNRERAARAEVEAADKAKDDFLAMLAHELRNPLAPIGAALYVLEQEKLESDAARRARTVIGRQLQHMNRLVDDLLDVTRIVRGNADLHRETVDLTETLRSVAEDHAQIASKAGIALTLEVPDEPVRVDGDPTRLAQIAGNLLQNAVRFTPAGGRIVLSLARRGPSAEIRVRDTGAGIEPELLKKLFEPFVQGAQAGATTRRGLGLGLSLARLLAELHGGSAQAFSAGPGQGAEFVVTLPAK